ncbi:unnamed protein product, partial [Urochloa humidicola]
GQPPQLLPLPPPAATHHDHHQQCRPIQPPARTTAIFPLESIGSTHSVARMDEYMDALMMHRLVFLEKVLLMKHKVLVVPILP